MVRPYLRWVIAFSAILVAGIVMLALVDHSDMALVAVGLAVISVGSVGLVSLAFYIVGRSEDEERRRTQQP